MMSLPTLSTRQDVIQTLDCLIYSDEIKVKNWAKDKKQGWVLAALCKPFSKMDSNE